MPPSLLLRACPLFFWRTHSIGSATIPTAHHLVWLCCLEYVDLYSEEEAAKSSVYVHAEFNCTLHSAALSNKHKDELRVYHHYLSTPEPPTTVPKVHRMSLLLPPPPSCRRRPPPVAWGAPPSSSCYAFARGAIARPSRESSNSLYPRCNLTHSLP